jgi:hypothetical protein
MQLEDADVIIWGYCCRQASRVRIFGNHHWPPPITLTSETGLSEEIES